MRANRLIMNIVIASILGFAICLLIKSITIHRDIQSSAVFVAELDKEVMPGQRITAESLLKDIDHVDVKSIRLKTAGEALEDMKKEMPELTYLSDNPFRDIIIFQTHDLKAKDVATWSHQITDISGIKEVFYDKALLDELAQDNGRPRIGVMTLALLILIGSLIILALRIKRDLKSYQEEVKIYSLAGASDQELIEHRRLWSTKWGAITAGLASLVMLVNILFMNTTLLDGVEITLLQSIISIVIMAVIVIGAHTLVTHQSLKAYFAQLNPSVKK